MATKRKSSPEDPVKAIRKLADKIRQELSSTEAEAHYTLCCIAPPPTESFFAHRLILAAHLYQKKKKCSEEDAFPSVTPEFEQAITPRDWAIFYTRGLMGQLEVYRKKMEKGHFASFLRAVQVCGYDGFPLPEWIKGKIGKGYAAYAGHRAKTLDEVFDTGRPHKYHRATAEWRIITPFLIYRRCEELFALGYKTGAETGTLFQTVGEEFDLSPSTARDYYYAEKKRRRIKTID